MRTQVKRAFTLIEILIVVVILGILAAIVIPQFTNASQEAAMSSAQSQLQTVRSQIELYRIQNQCVIPNIATAQWVNFTDPTQNSQNQRYLQQAPRNPLQNNDTTVAAGDATFTGGGAGWVWDNANQQLYAVDAAGAVLTDPNSGNPF